MGKVNRRGGKKGRKIGRNLTKCAWYRNSKRREKNKIKKIKKHLKRHSQDFMSAKRLTELEAFIKS